jgi:hypothetical protein
MFKRNSRTVRRTRKPPETLDGINWVKAKVMEWTKDKPKIISVSEPIKCAICREWGTLETGKFVFGKYRHHACYESWKEGKKQ